MLMMTIIRPFNFIQANQESISGRKYVKETNFFSPFFCTEKVNRIWVFISRTYFCWENQQRGKKFWWRRKKFRRTWVGKYVKRNVSLLCTLSASNRVQQWRKSPSLYHVNREIQWVLAKTNSTLRSSFAKVVAGGKWFWKANNYELGSDKWHLGYAKAKEKLVSFCPTRLHLLTLTSGYI